MAYGTKYIINFKNEKDVSCQIVIEKNGYVGSYSLLEAGPQPFTLSYRNGEDDKFEPIRASEATIQLLQGAVSISDFVGDGDNDFRVNFFYRTNDNPITIWRGIIIQDDISVSFTNNPNIIELRATDGIGLLKGVTFDQTDLEDYGLETPQKISSIIGACLDKTYLELKYRIHNNIFEDDQDDRTVNAYNCAFDQTYLDTYTFMSDVTKYESCYDVLEKILSSWNCTLFQYNGIWQIMRVQEMIEGRNLYGTLYNADRTISTSETASNREYLADISAVGDLIYCNADQINKLVRPVRRARAEYYWEIFPDLPKNSRWLNGTVQPSPESGLPVYDAVLLDDWDHSGVSKYYLRRYYDNGIPSNNQYLYLKWDGSASHNTNTSPSTTNKDSYIGLRSTPFRVNAGDICQMTYDSKFETSPSGTSWTIASYNAMILLDDLNSSDIYTYNQQNETWVKNKRYLFLQTWNGGFELATDWKTNDVETQQFPVDGTLYIYFMVPGAVTASYVGNQQVHFRNFRFRYSPAALTGKGYFHQLSQNKSVSNEDVYQVYLNDGRIAVSKGAMFLSDGNFTNQWGYSGGTKDKNFLQINARGHYRGKYRYPNTLSGSFYGVTYDDANTGTTLPIGLLNRYRIQDISVNKRFMMTSLTIDYKTEISQATLFEVYDSSTSDASTTGDNELNGYIH